MNRTLLAATVVAIAFFAAACASTSTSKDPDPGLDTGVDRPAAKSVISTPAGDFVYLGVNGQGYLEYRRTRDGATMVLVAAGPFNRHLYTPDPREDLITEIMDLPAFLIDKYEITNAQVKTFLDAHPKDLKCEGDTVFGPDGKVWLKRHNWGLTWNDGSQSVQVADGASDRHPSLGASGHLALAYARWVGGDLPFDYEWEKSAAGPSGLLFPWGDDMPDSTRCNGFLWGPRKTMPVGSYPAGVSPFGCHDMAGNVYERAYATQGRDGPVREARPTSIKGASWLSPSWINFRNLDRCGQDMDACEGSVGFRVLIRNPDVLKALGHSEPPRLRVLDDVEAAFAEAARRNVPIFLFLGHETCGSTDRVREEIFTDPVFIEYCNEHVVVLAGHDPYDGAGSPVPGGPDGESLLYPGCRTERLQEAYDYFVHKVDVAVVPDQVSRFSMSPAMFALNPHRELMENPEQLVLVPERAMPKGGVGRDILIARCREAQRSLGTGQSRTEFLAGKPGPKTAWTPPRED